MSIISEAKKKIPVFYFSFISMENRTDERYTDPRDIFVTAKNTL